MSNKRNNLGVQLMPALFVIISVVYYQLQNSFYAAACFILAVLFAVVIVAEALKE